MAEGTLTVFLRKAVAKAEPYLPQVPKPKKKLPLQNRLLWCGGILLIYMVMGQTPLYGASVPEFDFLAFARVIFASQQGTLVELGIGPIVTAGLLMQLLRGSEILKFDFKNYGILRRENVADLLRKSAIFIDMSTYQAFGRTGIEAMACGCAIVATSVAAAGLSNEVKSTLVLADDESSFADVIRNLLKNHEKRREMGEKAKKQVKAHYDWSVLIPRLLNAYQEVELG